MKQSIKERIIESFKLNNNISKEILLIRLYEDYEKNIDYIDKNQNISLAAFKNSYNRINSKMKVNKNQNDYYNDEEIIEEINNYKVLLDYLINNFEINNKKKIKKTEETITILESYLKLPITFPNYIEKCIEEILNKTNKKKLKKVK